MYIKIKYLLRFCWKVEASVLGALIGRIKNIDGVFLVHRHVVSFSARRNSMFVFLILVFLLGRLGRNS